MYTVAHLAPLSMGFSRQEYWSGLPCPIPGDLPDPGIKPASHKTPALAGRFFTALPPGKPHMASSFCFFEEALLVFEEQDPNVDWATEVAAAVQNAVRRYCITYDEKNRELLPRCYWVIVSRG